MKKGKMILAISLCAFLFVFLKPQNQQSAAIEKSDIQNTQTIQQEIDDYMKAFTERYSTNAMNDSESAMHIEEFEAVLDDSGSVATVVKYSDNANHCLRYRVDLYGETMNTVINYYLCDNFVLVSRQNHYYSSWILTAGWNDILYSEMDKWIFLNDKVYTFSDSGVLEETDKEQLEVPMLWEIENFETSQMLQ